MRGRLVDAPSP